MTAREYLERPRRMMRQTEANAEQIIRLRALAERITAAYGPNAGGGGGAADRRAEIVAKLVDMERELTQENEALIDAWEETAAQIAAVPDETERTLLQMRYLGGAPFVRIAEKLGYCERQVRRLHRVALENFAYQEKDVLECPHGNVV